MATNTYDFPDDLLRAQQDLHTVRRELSALYRRLPQYTDTWSEEDQATVRQKPGTLLKRCGRCRP